MTETMQAEMLDLFESDGWDHILKTLAEYVKPIRRNALSPASNDADRYHLMALKAFFQKIYSEADVPFDPAVKGLFE
jgi:hypothetical protein